MALTPNDVKGVVSQIAYKPDYRLLLRQDAPQTAIDDHDQPMQMTHGRWYLQVECTRPDTFTGAVGNGRGGKSYLSPFMTLGEIVRKSFNLFSAYEEHECRESFRWNGRRVFGPHISVESLWTVADDLDVRAPLPEASK